MKTKLLIQLLPILAASLLLTGCFSFHSSRSSKEPPSATLGEELIDLKAARDNGAISEDEYQQQRQKLLGH